MVRVKVPGKLCSKGVEVNYLLMSHDNNIRC